MPGKLIRAGRDKILQRGIKIAESSLPSWLTEAALEGAYAAKDTFAAHLEAFTTHLAAFTAHVTNVANPHAVTKAQVGLGNADNTSDAAKPVSTATQTALNGKSNTGHGHTFADITGQVSTAQLPPLAINDTFPVASQAAMLALTAQRGDMAIRSDNGRTYVLSTDSPSTLADWKEVMAAGQVQSVAGKTGVVSLVKGDVGLGNVDNTTDANKPVSTPQQTALDKLAKGCVYSGKVASSSGSITGVVVVYNIPTFTFKGGRKYRIVWDTDWLPSTGNVAVAFIIGSCSVGDAASSTATTQMGVRNAQAAVGTISAPGGVTAYYEPATDQTIQVKFLAQTDGTGGSLIVQGNRLSNPVQYRIYDDGMQP